MFPDNPVAARNLWGGPSLPSARWSLLSPAATRFAPTPPKSLSEALTRADQQIGANLANPTLLVDYRHAWKPASPRRGLWMHLACSSPEKHLTSHAGAQFDLVQVRPPIRVN